METRDSGEERRVRGGSETGGGLQASGYRLALFVRAVPFAAGKRKHRFVPKNTLSWFFLPFSRSCTQTMVSSPRVFFYFSSLFFLTSINCWEDVAFPRHVLECECVVVSQQHLRVLVCVSVGLCVCVFHIIYKLIYKLLGMYVYYIKVCL